MEASFLTYAKKLQAIASTGIFFSETEFDRERYIAIAEIANNMLAEIGRKPLAEIPDLFPDFARGYATPKVDVRGAIFRGDQVLMVREKLDGLWTLPGGYADVGLSAAENVVKEVHEEAGLVVSAAKLVSVFHKARHEYNPDARDFYKFYFLCEEQGTDDPSVGSETSDVGFYPVANLPPLSLGRSIRRHIELAFEHSQNPQLQTVFD